MKNALALALAFAMSLYSCCGISFADPSLPKSVQIERDALVKTIEGLTDKCETSSQSPFPAEISKLLKGIEEVKNNSKEIELQHQFFQKILLECDTKLKVLDSILSSDILKRQKGVVEGLLSLSKTSQETASNYREKAKNAQTEDTKANYLAMAESFERYSQRYLLMSKHYSGIDLASLMAECKERKDFLLDLKSSVTVLRDGLELIKSDAIALDTLDVFVCSVKNITSAIEKMSKVTLSKALVNTDTLEVKKSEK